MLQMEETGNGDAITQVGVYWCRYIHLGYRGGETGQEMGGAGMSYWIDGEQWLTAGEAARLWRELTETELSDSTWRRMGPDDRLTAMGLRVSDDGGLTHKVTMLELIKGRAARMLRAVDDEMSREAETMKGLKK